jgi:hypothetical protein
MSLNIDIDAASGAASFNSIKHSMQITTCETPKASADVSALGKHIEARLALRDPES